MKYSDLVYKPSVILFNPLRQIEAGFDNPHENYLEEGYNRGGVIMLDRHNRGFNESYNCHRKLVERIEIELGIQILITELVEFQGCN
jgi:hypothetical protein